MDKTLILSNGSKWAGQEPDSIETLLGVLEKEPLDKTFEDYGNFFGRVHLEDFKKGLNNKFASKWEDSMHFWGNFKNYSHVFSIYTFDQEIIVKLINAIEDNKQREDYKRQMVEVIKC